MAVWLERGAERGDLSRGDRGRKSENRKAVRGKKRRILVLRAGDLKRG